MAEDVAAAAHVAMAERVIRDLHTALAQEDADQSDSVVRGDGGAVGFRESSAMRAAMEAVTELEQLCADGGRGGNSHRAVSELLSALTARQATIKSVRASVSSSMVSMTPASAATPAPAAVWDAVVGHEEAKAALMEAFVVRAAVDPALMKGCRRAAATVLLYGPPGTGKTSLAKAAAGAAGYAMVPISPSTVLSKWAGESESALRRVFEQARERDRLARSGDTSDAARPALLFFDELDALAGSRGGSGGDDAAQRRLLCELLVQLSELRPEDRMLVVAATNRVHDIDPAMQRRFDVQISVGLPGLQDRKELVRRSLSGIAHSLDDAALAEVAQHTCNWSHADIAAVCRDAAMAPVREAAKSHFLSPHEPFVARRVVASVRPVALADFLRALGVLSGAR